jgi:hypothetical protein
VLPDDRQLALELRAIDSERPHVGSNDVFANVAIHLDDDWPREPGPGHDEVVTFDRTRLLRCRSIRGNRYTNEERFAQKVVRGDIDFTSFDFLVVQRSEMGLLQRPLQRSSLDTAFEPELDSLVETSLRVVCVVSLRRNVDRWTDGHPALIRIAPHERAQRHIEGDRFVYGMK